MCKFKAVNMQKNICKREKSSCLLDYFADIIIMETAH